MEKYLIVCVVFFWTIATTRKGVEAQGMWTSAALTVGRYGLTATAVDNFAIFAGGANGSSGIISNQVDIFNALTRVLLSFLLVLSDAKFSLIPFGLASPIVNQLK